MFKRQLVLALAYRHTVNRVGVAALVGLTALGGCAAYQAENKPLSEYPGIQNQIENFYDTNAIEDDWACDSPQMQSIDRSQVVAQTTSQVRMAIAYYFRSTALQEGQGADYCQGFNTRFFTFDKGAGGRLSLVKMSGPQRPSG